MRRRTIGLVAALAFATGLTLGARAGRPSEAPDLFVMMLTTGPAWDPSLPPNRQPHFDTHSANLARLRREDRIVTGGRFGQWGLILVQAEDEAAARALFEPDSSLAAGTFRGELHTWSTLWPGFVPER